MHMLKRKQKLPHSLLHCWKLISIETEMEIIKQFIRGRYGRCMLAYYGLWWKCKSIAVNMQNVECNNNNNSWTVTTYVKALHLVTMFTTFLLLQLGKRKLSKIVAKLSHLTYVKQFIACNDVACSCRRSFSKRKLITLYDINHFPSREPLRLLN